MSKQSESIPVEHQLKEDIHLALQCLAAAEQANKTLIRDNQSLMEENEVLSTEIQDVLEEMEEVRRQNRQLLQLRVETDAANISLAKERDCLLEELNDYTRKDRRLTSEMLEEELNMALSENRTKMASMARELKRTEETLNMVVAQKDDLEKEVHRLQSILLEWKLPKNSGKIDTPPACRNNWLNTAVDFFVHKEVILAPPSTAQGKLRRLSPLEKFTSSRSCGAQLPEKSQNTPLSNRRINSVDDNGFEAFCSRRPKRPSVNLLTDEPKEIRLLDVLESLDDCEEKSTRTKRMSFSFGQVSECFDFEDESDSDSDELPISGKKFSLQDFPKNSWSPDKHDENDVMLICALMAKNDRVCKNKTNLIDMGEASLNLSGHGALLKHGTLDKKKKGLKFTSPRIGKKWSLSKI